MTISNRLGWLRWRLTGWWLDVYARQALTAWQLSHSQVDYMEYERRVAALVEHNWMGGSWK